MKLLDEIIDLLADENGSLNAALLKTKVLMHTIGHAELADWVNDELNGYSQSHWPDMDAMRHGPDLGIRRMWRQSY